MKAVILVGGLGTRPSKETATRPKPIAFDATKPDGTLRKLMDSNCLNASGWQARAGFEQGLKTAYSDLRELVACWP